MYFLLLQFARVLGKIMVYEGLKGNKQGEGGQRKPDSLQGNN